MFVAPVGQDGGQDRIVPAATWPTIATVANRLGIAPLLHHKLRHAGTHTLLPPEPAAFQEALLSARGTRSVLLLVRRGRSGYHVTLPF